MNLEKILYRILLGYYYIYIDNIQYKVIYPSLSIRYEAECLYDSIIENNKYDRAWLTEKEISLQLKLNNLWNSENDDELKVSQDSLENYKIDLYLNFNNISKKESIKKQISNLIKDIDRLLNKKYSLNYLGITDHATTIKNEFLIMNTIYGTDSNLVFKNPKEDSYEYKKLQLFISEIIDNNINIKDLRALARSEIWKSYSQIINLEKNIQDINDDYRHLINLHKMYENAKQHPECPSDSIMEDDDALDGWFIFQNRKIEQEKKKNAILDKVGGNIKKAGEVFLMSTDTNERKEILSLNDPKQRQNIKDMIRLQKEHGSVDWKDLPFVKEDLQKQISDGIAAHQKNKG